MESLAAFPEEFPANAVQVGSGKKESK